MSASPENPVLGVCGYLDWGSTPWWEVMDEYLGRDDVNLVDVVYDRDLLIISESVDPVKKQAEQLRAKVEELYDRYGRIDIVAHSKGGIDSRYMIEHLGCQHMVDNLVTVASPNQGTWIANGASRGLGTAASGLEAVADILDGGQLSTASSFVSELGDKVDRAGQGAADLAVGSDIIQSLDPDNLGEVQMYAVHSPADELVVPQRNGGVPGDYDNVENIVTSPHEHIEMIFSRHVYNKFRSYLS